MWIFTQTCPLQQLHTFTFLVIYCSAKIAYLLWLHRDIIIPPEFPSYFITLFLQKMARIFSQIPIELKTLEDCNLVKLA